jgi:hypothetical protein
MLKPRTFLHFFLYGRAISHAKERKIGRNDGCVCLMQGSSRRMPCWRLAAGVAASLLFAGCAAHKTPPPPAIVYPATPEAELRELRSLPQGPYDRVEIVTVTAEVGEQLEAAIKAARQSAAQKGANALVVLRDTEFRQKIKKRRVTVRRITYLAIHRR